MDKLNPFDLNQILHECLGYDSFRPGQEAAIQSVLDGYDTLVVMPTGSGKSTIYQIAAHLLPGATVVVSPLIALQRDQVNTIANQAIGNAALVNSTVQATERQEAFEQLEQGDIEFLFLAPEQFNLPETLERLKTVQPSLFVVDEAHCISAWGHDFRPDYLRLGQVIEALGHPRILALTATAAPPVRNEIVERLGMQTPTLLVQGFDRPNLELNVERFKNESEKQDSLLRRISQVEKPGIVYVATRKRAEELAQQLRSKGLRSHFYHAGMKSDRRQRIEAAFMDDKIDVLVATTAFGMGIDKPNIRFVFHADISDSLDAYYQQIGRAGRDDNPATIFLFYNPDDLRLQNFLNSRGKVDTKEIRHLLKVLRTQKQAIAPKDLQQKIKLSKTKLQQLLNPLAATNAIEILPTGEIRTQAIPPRSKSLVDTVLQGQERRKQLQRSRLDMMRGYAEVHSCRREYLLNYFGEKYVGPCGNCDNCKAGISSSSATERPVAQRPYAIDSRVAHQTWGEGTITRYEQDTIIILFDEVGYKTLDIQTTLLRQLLRRVESSTS